MRLRLRLRLRCRRMRSSGTPEPTRDGRAPTRSVGWSTLHRSLQPRERTTQPGSDGGYSGQRGGEGGGKGRSPRLQTQPRRPSRPGGHRRGEARRKCWKLQRSPSEMSRAGPRYCDRATAPSGIPIQFQSRHTQAQAPAGTREPCPKHAVCPEGAQERGRVQGCPLSILAGPRPMLDLPSFLVCRFGGDRETSAANCRCAV